MLNEDTDRRRLKRARALLEMFEQSADYGFTPDDYRVGELRALASETPGALGPDRVAQFELTLTRSVLRFAVDIQGGRISTINIPREARPQSRAIDGGATTASVVMIASPTSTRSMRQYSRNVRMLNSDSEAKISKAPRAAIGTYCSGPVRNSKIS